jgi:23S rRNA pseudouridine2604 synthase
MTDSVRLAKRLVKIVSCSRREAELYIAGGWVTVDGQVVEEPQFMVSDQKAELHPEANLIPVEPVTILFHLPPNGHGRDVNYDESCHDRFPSPQSSDKTTSHSTRRQSRQVAGYPASGESEARGAKPGEREKQSSIPAGMDANSAQQLIRPDTRAADDPSGIHMLKQHFVRLTQHIPLERNASGLLVFTQDWRVARKLIDDAATVEQEYIVEVAGELPPDGLKRLNHGLDFNGRALPPIKVSWQNETRLRFALKGVRPGQIAHMCQSVGLQVLAMKRIRIGQVSMAKLQPGLWRYLMPHERF